MKPPQWFKDQILLGVILSIVFLFVMLASGRGEQSTLSSSRSQPPTRTETMPNGKFWMKMTEDQKAIWVHGYSDGIKVAAVFVQGAEPENKALAQAILDMQPSDKLTTMEIAKRIDEFYRQAPENLDRPIAGAFMRVDAAAH